MPIETVAEHLITTHVHDNRRHSDDHLVPYRGSIDWDAALMTMQKIGYDGTYMMELANTGTPAAVLEEARRARQRFEKADARTARAVDCTEIDATYIEDIAKHEGQAVTLRGWLHNRRSSGKIHFLTVRDGSGFIQCVMSKKAVGDEMFTQGRPPLAGERGHRRRHGARRRARARRLRDRRHDARGRLRAPPTTRSRRRSTASTT